MARPNLCASLEFIDCDTDTAAGTGEVLSDAITVGGADSIVAVVQIGTVTSTGTNVVKIEECDTSGGTYSDITGATTGTLTDTGDTAAIVEVVRPRKKFVKISCTRAVANTVLDGMYALVRGRQNPPITQGATAAEAPTVVKG